MYIYAVLCCKFDYYNFYFYFCQKFTVGAALDGAALTNGHYRGDWSCPYSDLHCKGGWCSAALIVDYHCKSGYVGAAGIAALTKLF
jgi:hypothetical protein